MSSIDDLAALIAHHRAQLERAFESEIAKLRLAYGERLVSQALARASRFTPESEHWPPPSPRALRARP